MQHTSPTHLTVRRLNIDLKQGFDRRWCNNDAFLSAFLNALSMSFPVGEQFFIDSVKSGAKHLPSSDEGSVLKKIGKQFIGQEATHRHLHTQYNAILTTQGFKNHWEVRLQHRINRLKSRWLKNSPHSHLHELAITAALEHYTAILGDLLLEKTDQEGDWLLHAQEPLKTMWRWHAAEESEHKDIAFDIYSALGGTYKMRVLWFIVTSLEFFMDVTRQTVNNLWHDKALFNLSTWSSALNFTMGKHGLVWRMTKPALTYFKRDFHPSKVGQIRLSKNWLLANKVHWTAVGAANQSQP